MEKEPNSERMHVNISPITPEDIYQANEVFYKTWLDTYPNEKLGITEDDIHHKFQQKDEEFFERKKKEIANLPEGSGYLVARVEDKIVGVVIYFSNKELNEIKAIYVLPEYQGHGIGFKLWKEALLDFDDTKDSFVNVADYNKNAIAFYEKLGFVDTGNRFADERFKLKSGSVIPEMRMIRKAGI
ncbi:MAG TPA: GNAT family N-acetyltransferase [Candidatus Paceibacterota bacterium]|nr:GNAT family N-acetyltransferase [Candidatus Paceibacterota bacterium]